jgi:hypothetical protein
MPISANSLFHFTDKKDSLKKILEENFRIFFCKERTILCDMVYEYHVPMVSLCDIPLSQIKEHISKYGNYGIGMTREWGIRNKLNPVLYLEPQSDLATSYKAAFRYMGDREVGDGHFNAVSREFADVLRYLKNYQADLYRKGVLHTAGYRFANEREWRYVPGVNTDVELFYLTDEFKDAAILATAQHSVAHLRVDFEPNDIKFIIIKDDSEITEFITHLRQVMGHKAIMHDVERLTTRIFTSKQIHDDI